MENEELLNAVIERIRKIRISRGVSQFELSNRANFSQSFLANLEAGKKKPSVMTIIRIANALEISPKDFFPETGNKIGEIKKSREEIKKEIVALLDSL